MNQEEQEKRALEKNIESLQEKLSQVNANLEKHKSLCESYEKTIIDTETGFKKVLDSYFFIIKILFLRIDFREQPDVVKLSATRGQ